MAAVRPGPASVKGLDLLVEVGPMPIEVWGLAMGWGQAATYSHAKRLAGEGWLARCQRVRGDGALVYATRIGSQMSAVNAVPVLREPAPHTWPHLDGCAWTAAWLRGRGRDFLGPRGLLARDGWNGRLVWTERGEFRRRGHRPDLVGVLPSGDQIPIEVELTEKSSRRLKAIVDLHMRWLRSGDSAAVIYICADEHLAEKVLAAGKRAGFNPDRGTIRVELLETIKRETLDACADKLVDGWYLLSGRRAA